MVCEVQSDFGLKAKANVATNKGNPVGVDCDERALLPIENANYPKVPFQPFCSVVSLQHNGQGFSAIDKGCSQMEANQPLISGQDLDDLSLIHI